MVINHFKIIVKLKGNWIGLFTDEKLHVFTQSGDAILRIEGNSSSSEARTEFWKWSGQYGSGVGFWPGNSNLRIRTMSSNGSNAGEIVFETESEEKMRIKKNGMLELEQQTQSEKLDIEDTTVNQNAVISLAPTQHGPQWILKIMEISSGELEKIKVIIFI
ncbi:MAG: hypothetical protein CM15mP65_02920 [Crocinitomicaceae bacterium]|nr:MAG: hypothetical protein CM15mP65_02920 [Crocinitomicaceae bacterium]